VSAAQASSAERTGLELTLHTPLAWIQQLASDAASEHRTVGLDDVTGEMGRQIADLRM
jgi:hypothetical protein